MYLRTYPKGLRKSSERGETVAFVRSSQGVFCRVPPCSPSDCCTAGFSRPLPWLPCTSLCSCPLSHTHPSCPLWLQTKGMALLGCKYLLLLPCEIPFQLTQSMSKVTVLLGTAWLTSLSSRSPSSLTPSSAHHTAFGTLQTQRPRATGCLGGWPCLQHLSPEAGPLTSGQPRAA